MLPGHSKPSGPAPVALKVGEVRLALIRRWAPMNFGYEAGLASADPSIVAVVYDEKDTGLKRPKLQGLKAGTCTVYYINHFLCRDIVQDEKLTPAQKQAAIEERCRMGDAGNDLPVMAAREFCVVVE